MDSIEAIRAYEEHFVTAHGALGQLMVRTKPQRTKNGPHSPNYGKSFVDGQVIKYFAHYDVHEGGSHPIAVAIRKLPMYKMPTPHELAAICILINDEAKAKAAKAAT